MNAARLPEVLKNYVTEMPGLPAVNPPHMPLSGESFDPSRHLQLEPPNSIKDLQFCDVPFPYLGAQTKVQRNMAYTKPFRVLSDEGIAAARRAISQHDAALGKGNARASRFIRGLGYVSNWHRGLAYSPELMSMLNQFSRDNVAPHTMNMNISHTNVGKIGTGKAVDKWHTDSTDYVLIIILSDLTDMQGGELRVLQKPDATGCVFQELQRAGIPPELVETVRYTGVGYGVFMQGSKILHTVNGVLAAREPRLSLVNSYMTLRPFSPDMTKYSTFLNAFDDGAPIASVEFTRHKAWRASGQMKAVLEAAQFGGGEGGGGEQLSPEELAGALRVAGLELQDAAGLLDGAVDDDAKFLEEGPKKVLSRL